MIHRYSITAPANAKEMANFPNPARSQAMKR